MGTKQNVKWTIPNWEIPKGEVHKLEIPWGANWKILNNAYLNQPKKKKTTQTIHSFNQYFDCSFNNILICDTTHSGNFNTFLHLVLW